jgi:hypothetical protein
VAPEARLAVLCQSGLSINQAQMLTVFTRYGSSGEVRLACSAMGHSRHFDDLSMTSGLPSGSDIVSTGRHVSNVPGTDHLGTKVAHPTRLEIAPAPMEMLH